MEKQFDTLGTYITLAKKMISKFAPKFYKTLAYEMLSNEDAISDVANAIMTADWKFDQHRVGKITGQQKTKYSYRNQCAIWAIKSYISAKYKKSSRNYSYDNILFADSDNNSNNPLNNLIESESENLKKEYIDQILDSDILTEKQKDQIKLYYFSDMTLSEIGKKYGVTREAVRQNLLKGIKSIQAYV
jgi:RNA polymerase sigma factor (sigma-70 family)